MKEEKEHWKEVNTSSPAQASRGTSQALHSPAMASRGKQFGSHAQPESNASSHPLPRDKHKALCITLKSSLTSQSPKIHDKPA